MHNSKKSSTFAPVFHFPIIGEPENCILGREVAQPGSATVWGTGGRVFESRLPDKRWFNDHLFCWDEWHVLLPDKRTSVLFFLFQQRKINFCNGLNLDTNESCLHIGILTHKINPPIRFVQISKSAHAQCTAFFEDRHLLQFEIAD